jgi:hypothetical protein
VTPPPPPILTPQVPNITWSEVMSRLVALQASTRLVMSCVLDEEQLVARIMRKDNYLIALINMGVLNLGMPIRFEYTVLTR